MDATGLKIYGEGEWKMRVHRKSKRRTWRKLHLAIDPYTFQIQAFELTKANKTDGKVLKPLLKDIETLGNVYSD